MGILSLQRLLKGVTEFITFARCSTAQSKDLVMLMCYPLSHNEGLAVCEMLNESGTIVEM